MLQDCYFHCFFVISVVFKDAGFFQTLNFMLTKYRATLLLLHHCSELSWIKMLQDTQHLPAGNALHLEITKTFVWDLFHLCGRYR